MNGFAKILYMEHRGKNTAITSKQIEKEFGYIDMTSDIYIRKIRYVMWQIYF